MKSAIQLGELIREPLLHEPFHPPAADLKLPDTLLSALALQTKRLHGHALKQEANLEHFTKLPAAQLWDEVAAVLTLNQESLRTQPPTGLT